MGTETEWCPTLWTPHIWKSIDWFLYEGNTGIWWLMTILCLQHSWQGIPAQILLVYGVCRSTKKLFCFFQLELQLLLAAQPGKNSTPQLVVSNFCSIFFYLPKMLAAMSKIFQLDTSFVVLCAIWYHSYNLKNVKNTHGGVFLLVAGWSLQLY